MDAPKRFQPGAAALFLVFFVFCGAALFFMEIHRFAQSPADPSGTVKPFTVFPGETFREIARRLDQENIVQSAWKLRWYARLKGDEKRIQAGEYALSAALTPAAILESLVSGRVILHRVTIPEGFTLSRIATLLAQKGIVDRDRFIQAATDPNIARRLGVNAPSLEGYLFPETYYFPRPASPETVLSAMVKAFFRAFKPQWKRDAAKAGFSLHQIVILASMIEKETGAAFERPLIASVFYNRLRKKMRLQSDPTVIYGMKNFDGNLTRKDLERPTPYNTYQIFGLPPGPIANPGAGALRAAVYPAKTRFLYFVSKNDGTHFFSESLREHRSAVSKHQKKRTSAP